MWRSRVMRSWVALELVISVGLMCSSVYAEQPSTAEGLFRRGGELFQNDQYQQALEAYQRSYDLNPVNVVLYNIAMCQRALGRHGDAVETFERYLSRGGDDIPSERRQEVRGLIEEMRGLMGSQALTPSTSDRSVDSQVEQPEAGSPSEQTTDSPAQTSTTQPAVVQTEPVQPEPRPTRPGRGYLIGAYVAGGVAFALLATSVALFGWNAGRDNDWEDTSTLIANEWVATRDARTTTDAELEQMYQDNEALGEELRTWGAVEWALLGVGIAALGAAAGLLVVGIRSGRQTTASLTPGIGGFSFNLSWVTP